MFLVYNHLDRAAIRLAHTVRNETANPITNPVYTCEGVFCLRYKRDTPKHPANINNMMNKTKGFNPFTFEHIEKVLPMRLPIPIMCALTFQNRVITNPASNDAVGAASNPKNQNDILVV